MAEAVDRLMKRRMMERGDAARAEEKRLRQQVRRYRKTGRADDRYSEEVLAPLAALSEKKMMRAIRNTVVSWVFFALGDTYAFTENELAEFSGVDVGTTRAFLHAMSLDFGNVPSDFAMPSPSHPLQTRPVVHSDGRYLCPVPWMLVWGLRPAVESLMIRESADGESRDASVWEHYQRARADFLESEALRLLSHPLRHAETYQKLRYRPPPDYQETELDGMVMFDNVLLLLECKAGTFSPPARRGSPLRMVEDLKKLVGDAHSQALRARRYIDEEAQPIFKLPDDTEVRMDKQRFARFFLVTVTLDSLDAFAPVLHEVAEIGIFEPGDLPWAVNILDLNVISELVEFPCQLVHYLTRRLELNRHGKVEAGDELDWFGHYLAEGLYFREMLASGMDRLSLLTYTTAIDDYYFFITGQRKTPASKPCQTIPPRLRQIIDELESQHGPGYVDVVCALLDMGGKARQKMGKLVDSCRKLSKKDSGLQDFTLPFPDMDTGITFIAAYATPPEELVRRLRLYCSLKKYQMKMRRWIGLASHVRLPGIVHAFFVADFPWEYDRQMEEAIRQLPGPRTIVSFR